MHVNQNIWNYAQINCGAPIDSNQITAGLIYRRNWFNFAGAPEFIGSNIQFANPKNKIAWSVNISQVSGGLMKRNDFKIGLKYSTAISRSQKITFGIRAGFIRTSFNWDKIKVQSPEEFSNVSQFSSLFMPGIDLGCSYQFRGLLMGISSNNFYSGSPKNNTNQSLISLVSDNCLLFSYQLKSNNWNYTPRLIFRGAQGLAPTLDFSISCKYKQILSAALGYRSNTTYYFIFGTQISRNIQVNYSCDYSTNTYNMAGCGNEIGLLLFLGEKNN